MSSMFKILRGMFYKMKNFDPRKVISYDLLKLKIFTVVCQLTVTGFSSDNVDSTRLEVLNINF